MCIRIYKICFAKQAEFASTVDHLNEELEEITVTGIWLVNMTRELSMKSKHLKRLKSLCGRTKMRRLDA
jgi:hypothetical protein